MNILFVNEYFPPVAPGGAEWSVFYLLSRLASSGVSVALATVHHGPDPQPIGGVPLYAMPFPFILPPGQKMHRQGILENPLFHHFYSRHVFRAAQEFKADLIHAQSKHSLPAAVWAAQRLGVPVVYTLRDIGLTCPFNMCFVNGRGRCDGFTLPTLLGSCSRFLVDHYTSGGLWQNIKVRLLALFLAGDTRRKQRCLKNLDRVISPSRGLIEAYAPGLLPGPDRFAVVPHLPPPSSQREPAPECFCPGSSPNITSSRHIASSRHVFGRDPKLLSGRDPDFLNDKNGLGPGLRRGDGTELPEWAAGRFVLTAGKRSIGKGTYTLLDAAARLRERFPGVLFVLVGKGPVPAREQAGVLFLESFPHEQLLALMQKAEVVAVPSIVPEAFNRVVLEAMTFGKPVVGTRCGSLPEQIEDGVTGCLALPGNAEDLSRALEDLLSNPDRARAMGERGRERVKTLFSEEESLKKLLAVYNSVIDEKSGAGAPR